MLRFKKWRRKKNSLILVHRNFADWAAIVAIISTVNFESIFNKQFWAFKPIPNKSILCQFWLYLSVSWFYFFSFFAIIYFALSLRLPLSLFSKCVLSTYIYFERTEKLWAIWKRATMNNNDRERKRKNTNISSRSSRRSWRRRWQVVWENDSHFQHNDKKAMDILYAIIRIKNTYG